MQKSKNSHWTKLPLFKDPKGYSTCISSHILYKNHTKQSCESMSLNSRSFPLNFGVLVDFSMWCFSQQQKINICPCIRHKWLSTELGPNFDCMSSQHIITQAYMALSPLYFKVRRSWWGVSTFFGGHYCPTIGDDLNPCINMCLLCVANYKETMWICAL